VPTNTNAGGQFVRANATNAIGAPARVLIAPSSYANPVKLQNIFDLGVVGYPAQTATYGFIDIGMTSKPTTHQYQAAENDWKSEQTGTFKTLPTDWTGQIATESLEMTQQNKVNLMLGTAQTDAVAGVESVTYFSARAFVPTVHIAIAFIDEYGKIHCAYYPKAQWNGAAVQQAVARGQAYVIPMTWKIFPDTSIIDPVTGFAVFRADFDQYN
jgi:hypothetical protein